jgi:hypothetical protein
MTANFTWGRALLLACLITGSLFVAPAWSQPVLAGPCSADGNLDYYRCRHDDFVRRAPEVEAPDYYLSYGDRYVRRFSKETRPLLSPAGKAWLDRVRVGLQRAIEEKRRADPLEFVWLEREGPRFLDFAYETHPSAYLESGLAELPLRDLLIIGSTPDARDLFSERGRAQVVAVIRGLVGACLEEGLFQCMVSRVVRELRDRRRLISERLRLRPTGFMGAWLVKRLIGSAERELGEPRKRRAGMSAALDSKP